MQKPNHHIADNLPNINFANDKDRLLYEDAVIKSEANLNAILEHSDAGYVLYNSDLQIVTFNSRAQVFCGLLYRKKLKAGSYLLEYFSDDRKEVLLDIVQKVLAGDNIYYETPLTGADGTVTWMSVKWINVPGDKENIKGFILASQDITKSKLQEIEKERITLDLLKSSKALEQFTNITAHNLKEPVSNIVSLAQMIPSLSSEAERQDFIAMIIDSARSLNSVINDINQVLQFKHHLNEVKETVFFNEIVQLITSSLYVLTVKENVSIQINFDAVPSLITIKSYLYSIFYNLVLNSIKYRQINIPPQILITSSIAGEFARLTFKDNGKGIDLNKNGEKLFGLYQRFDPTVEGSGLGLFMIRSQIEALGGTIRVESQFGSGSTFFVDLPLYN